MSPSVAVVFGAIVFCFGAALLGVSVWPDQASRSRPATPRVPVDRRRLAAAVAAGAVGWVVTGWPVAAVALVAAMWVVPGMVDQRRERQRSLDGADAVAGWADQLRDLVAAGAGINDALATTARTAPTTIRPAVADLAVRLRHEPTDTALQGLADELAHPAADRVVTAVRLAVSARGERLSEVLDAIARHARDDANARRQIDAARAGLWRQASTVTGVMLAVAVILFLTQREYLAPFDSTTGQLVLSVIVALWFGSLRSMIRLAAGTPEPRLLGGVVS